MLHWRCVYSMRKSFNMLAVVADSIWPDSGRYKLHLFNVTNFHALVGLANPKPFQ